jgi:GNAT superfamily N-acetyltransferase
MKWLIEDLVKLTPDLRELLAVATPTWKNDYMHDAMKVCMKRKPGSYLAIALFNKNVLIGWAMLDFFLSGTKSIRTYIYVETKFRRKGYGTKILDKTKEIIKEKGKEIRVLPHDKTSRKFYKHSNIDKKEIVRGYYL